MFAYKAIFIHYFIFDSMSLDGSDMSRIKSINCATNEFFKFVYSFRALKHIFQDMYSCTYYMQDWKFDLKPWLRIQVNSWYGPCLLGIHNPTVSIHNVGNNLIIYVACFIFCSGWYLVEP